MALPSFKPHYFDEALYDGANEICDDVYCGPTPDGYSSFPEIGVFSIDCMPQTEEDDDASKDANGLNGMLARNEMCNATPLDVILKMGRKFRWKITFLLMDESGPAHHKVFKVKMSKSVPPHDNTEEFIAEASTIRKAKHAAASLCLEQMISDSELTDEKLVELFKTTPVEQLDKHIQKRDPSRYPMRYVVKRFGSQYCATVVYSMHYFTGVGSNKQEAKQNAADEVLRHIQNHDELSKAWDNLNKLPKPPKNIWTRVQELNTESPISTLNNLSIKYHSEAVYECLGKRGEDHAPVFTFQCSFANRSATGEGKSKKEARSEAAQALLHLLSRENGKLNVSSSPPTPISPLLFDNCIPDSPSSTKPKKKNDLKKYKLDEHYGQNIHPVVRLNQIQQATEKSEPTYFIQKASNADGKHFFEAFVRLDDGRSAKANGRNKKLAKRHAAEAMLRELGYAVLVERVKPGKGLLKSKSSYSASEESTITSVESVDGSTYIVEEPADDSPDKENYEDFDDEDQNIERNENRQPLDRSEVLQKLKRHSLNEEQLEELNRENEQRRKITFSDTNQIKHYTRQRIPWKFYGP